jgi:hypothetical protein
VKQIGLQLHGQRWALLLLVMNLQVLLPENEVVIFFMFWDYFNSVRHFVLNILNSGMQCNVNVKIG